MRLTEETITVSGSSVNVAIGPANGPPLMLLHGVLRRWQDFLPVIPSLATRWQVFAIDFRGHGMSGIRPGRYYVIDYVEDAIELLRHCHNTTGERVAIYGHSLGAMVALGAATGPGADMTRAVVLEDPPFQTMGSRLPGSSLMSQFAGYRPFVGSSQPLAEVVRGLADIPISMVDGSEIVLGNLRDLVTLRFFARCLRDVDPEVIEPILAGQWLEGYSESVPTEEVTAPVLLMQADVNAGGMLTDDDADTLESQLVDCARLKFAGAGHLLHWDHVEEVTKRTIGFLES